VSLTRFNRPPKALRKARLDNLVLMPASALPFKQHYQAIANRLEPGSVLVVLPATSRSPAAGILATAARRIAKQGRPVRTVLASVAPAMPERKEARLAW
jgi:hypothetical protein